MNNMNSNIYYKFDLFLDPGETSVVKLTELLQRKISEWNKKTNSDPKYKRFVEEAREFIDNPPFQNELQYMLKEAYEARLQELQAAIDDVEGDGWLEPEEYNMLIDQFVRTKKGVNKYFTEETIKEHLFFEVHASLDEIVPPPEPALPKGVKIIDDSKMGKIDKDLELLNKRDLYDFLGFNPNTPIDQLLNHTQNLNANNQRKPKKDAQTDAEGRILGFALSVFKTPADKQGYDITLRRSIKEFTETWKRRALNKKVERNDYAASIKEAAQKMSKEEAFWVVYNYYCIKRKCPWPYAPQVVICPHCQKKLSNNVGLSKCPYCGGLLKVICPKCQTEGNVADGNCKNCGFAIGDMNKALPELEKARQALGQKDIETAELALQQVEMYWPGMPDAEPVRQALDTQKKAQTELTERINTLKLTIRESFQRHNIYQAQRQILEYRSLVQEENAFDAEWREIERTFRSVHEKLSELDRIFDPEEKVKQCEDILLIAADCDEAQKVMDQIPPRPASHFAACESVGSILLSWEPSPSKRHSGYRILRKVGAVPVSPDDGEILIKSLNNTSYSDATAEPGVIYGYAVFTERPGNIDQEGCQSELIQTISDVKNVSILPNDGTIALAWMGLPTAIGIKISRWNEALDHGEAKIFHLENTKSFVDTGLNNETTYVYKIQSIFRGIDDKERLSHGVTLTAIPHVLPLPANDLSAVCDQKTIRFQWSPLTRGTLYLFPLTAPPKSIGSGIETISLEGLQKKFGSPIPIPSPNEGETDWQSPKMGIYYILPVSYDTGVAIYGKILRISQIDDIKNAKIQFVDSDVYLTWDWPNGVDRVRILGRSDTYPAGWNDSKAKKVTLTRQEYDTLKAYKRPWDFKDCNYLTIYSYFSLEDGSGIFSDGARILARRISLRYDLKITGKNPQKAQAFLEVTSESINGHIPELIVRIDTKRPPINRRFGEEIMRIPGTPQESLQIPINKSYLNKGYYVALFVADKSLAPFYSFNVPAPDELELKSSSPSKKKSAVESQTLKKGKSSDFVCPYCFEKVDLKDILFQCSNAQCSRYGKEFRSHFHFSSIFSSAVPVEEKCPRCKQPTSIHLCPHCKKTLPVDVNNLSNAVIAIVGARFSGKSHYITLLIQRIRRLYASFGWTLSAIDDETIKNYKDRFFNPLFQQHKTLNFTQSAKGNKLVQKPLLYSLTLKRQNQQQSVTLAFFDTAGEDMASEDTMESVYRYIYNASGIILFLDPFQMPEVRKHLPDALLPQDIDRDVTPTDMINRLSNLIERKRNIKRKDQIPIPLAVTLSKIDIEVLQNLFDDSSPLYNEAHHNGGLNLRDFENINHFMKEWIFQLDSEENGAVQAAARFKDAAFFGVSALGGAPTEDGKLLFSPRPVRVEDPFLWLLWKNGIIDGVRE